MDTERLPAGYKLVIKGPDSMLATAQKWGDDSIARALMGEYHSIYYLLSSLLGDGLIALADTPGFQPHQLTLPIPSIYLPQLSQNGRGWPRDAYLEVNGRVFYTPGAWDEPPAGSTPSRLGEGGKLIHHKDALVTILYNNLTCRTELSDLNQQGVRVGLLPVVEQRGNHDEDMDEFCSDHIDGHCSLVEEKGGNLVLLVAESYYQQSEITRDYMSEATRKIGANLVVIGDNNLPHLAFNLIQLGDLSIVMTSGAQPLQRVLEDLVGANQVYTTKIPIEVIPKELWAGIRCMTNLMPESWLKPQVDSV